MGEEESRLRIATKRMTQTYWIDAICNCNVCNCVAVCLFTERRKLERGRERCHRWRAVEPITMGKGSANAKLENIGRGPNMLRETQQQLDF